jgi:thymidylate synthase
VAVTHIVGDTIDDLLHRSFDLLCAQGNPVSPRRGDAIELIGVTLELTNPRARLSRSENRGVVFSALAELVWYLSGSRSTSHIASYIRRYEDEDEDGNIHGGYGPRLFDGPGLTGQVAQVVEQLKRKDSRQAVVQLFERDDLLGHKDVPCTTTLQYFLRNGSLIAVTNMRSNDVCFGLPHDIFCFTMLQELIARSVRVEIGSYIHMVGSFHFYEEQRTAVQRYLKEGWQSPGAMPSMPSGDPWPSVESLVEAECQLRNAAEPSLPAVDAYWADLERLLRVFWLCKQKERAKADSVCQEITAITYKLAAEERVERTFSGFV